MDPRKASETLGNPWESKTLVLGFIVYRMDPWEPKTLILGFTVSQMDPREALETLGNPKP
jgi:hypothetical protein